MATTSRYKGTHDIYFSSEGDLVIDPQRADLKDTKNLIYRDLIQRILTRVSSSRGDWSLQSQVGATLAAFIGKPNNATIGRAIKNAVENEISRILQPADYSVDVFPTSQFEMMLVIMVQERTQEQGVFLNFSYDMRDNRLVPRNVR